jgi:hypothetical protein
MDTLGTFYYTRTQSDNDCYHIYITKERHETRYYIQNNNNHNKHARTRKLIDGQFFEAAVNTNTKLFVHFGHQRTSLLVDLYVHVVQPQDPFAFFLQEGFEFCQHLFQGDFSAVLFRKNFLVDFLVHLFDVFVYLRSNK